MKFSFPQETVIVFHMCSILMINKALPVGDGGMIKIAIQIRLGGIFIWSDHGAVLNFPSKIGFT